MTITTKTVAAIKADLAEGISEGGITNFNPGGVAETIVQEVGNVASMLYDHGEDCVAAGMADTSEGDWLVRKLKERGLTQLPAVKASGTVFVGRNAPSATSYHMATGTQVGTRTDLSGRRWVYATTEDVTLTAGETEVEVSIEAVATGAGYNVAVGAINNFVRPVAGFDWVVNRTGWLVSEGADIETTAKMRERYFLAWDNLSRGATIAAYTLAALSADSRVTIAWVDANDPRGRGTINIYILGTDGLPTDDLILAVQEYIGTSNSTTGWKPAGDDVLVLAPAYKTVDITFTARRLANTDADALDATLRAALDAYFNPLGDELFSWLRPLGVGKQVLMSQLMEIVMRPDPMHDAIFVTPTADVEIAAHELPVLGTVTITHEEVAL